MAELRCATVAKSYGARAVLREVDLVVPEGTLTAILGASGSGKTTLLRLIIGFIAPDRGTIAVDGSVVAAAGGLHVPPDKREIGYVAQEGALVPASDSRRKRRVRPSARGAEERIAYERGARPRRARLGATPRGAPMSSPEANSAASASRGRSRRSRGSCCSTSRSPASTQTSGLRRARRSRQRWPQRARPRCSSPTTRPRRCRWDTRSPFCARDGSLRRRLRRPLPGPGRSRRRALRR